MTRPERLGALSQFLGGLAELSERTGVGIHAAGGEPLALDVDGQRFTFHATCHGDGSFSYSLALTAKEAS